ncbi:MAG: proteasome accessory factor PafA2 family protein [Nitrospirae bacterium]|jgi:proteasome accessory factor A|nr:proteasome accessory factor PafA2 family protein [Nitrospirota bacterium]
MTDFPIVMGIETEYGIVRNDLQESDPVIESMELVRSYQSADLTGWLYQGEDPSLDARGFRVDNLAQDEEEKAFTRSDYKRFFSFHEMKSDRILSNGGRFYNDHTHPEFSTPESSSVMELLRYDRAGLEILLLAKKERERSLGKEGGLSLYRNNTDYHGHSYGCHENYLLPRAIPFDRIVTCCVPFLVARTVLLGAGKYGYESSEKRGYVRYQASQRADFIETLVSVDTMHCRPLVNSRDEPHADRNHFRRLHLILGDANMSEWQTAMKLGMTKLVLKGLLLEGWSPDIALEDPVESIRQVSKGLRDQPLLRLRDRQWTALDILEYYSDALEKRDLNLDPEERWILSGWREAIDQFRKEPSSLSDRIDWIAKAEMLSRFREEESLAPDDPWLQSLDLEYHNIDPDQGLFHALEESGEMLRLTGEESVREAITHPPGQGRPPVRHAIIRRFPDDVVEAGWEKIRFRSGEVVVLPLFQSCREEEIARLIERIGGLSTPHEIVEVIRPYTEGTNFQQER